MNLKLMNDQSLLLEVKSAIAREKIATLHLLETFREVERRKLHLELGYASLFEFALKYAGLSEGSAHRRISAMRLMRDDADAKKQVESGALSVTNAARIYSITRREKTTPDMKKEVIEKCLTKTQKRCESILQDYFPDAATFKERARLIGDESLELKFILGKELAGKLEKLKDYLSHQNPERIPLKIFEILIRAEVVRQERKKGIVSATNLPAVNLASESEVETESTYTLKVSRSQKNPLNNLRIHHRKSLSLTKRRVVYKRGNQRCEFPDCTSAHQLEIDHRRPLGCGGTDEVQNLRILYKAHHLLETEGAQLGLFRSKSEILEISRLNTVEQNGYSWGVRTSAHIYHT